MDDFTEYMIKKIAQDTINKFTYGLKNCVKPFPLRNCIYNKVIKAGYEPKDFDTIQYNDLIKIKGIGFYKANEFLSARKNYKLKT